ncbi:MAG: acetyl-CoA acetyltransferase [Acidimicrobiales bacterium]
MTDWTRVPVLVGAGQHTNREEDPLRAPNPFELMESTAKAAAASAVGDAKAAAFVEELTHVFMVHSLSLRHGDPARALAERLGAKNADARTSGMGGSIPQWLVNRAAEMVVAGERPRVLITGAEALATRKRAKRAEVALDWPSSEGWPDTWPPLEPDLGVHKVERRHGLEQATTMYALIETAVRHAAGHDPATHDAAMGELMAGFNEVAAANPYSWFPARRSATEIMTVTADNRTIFYPYPKYVNAVMDVDMGASVIVTDSATAREWGMAPDEIAYLSGWADAHDIWYLSERPEIHRSPALSACGEAAFAMAGVDVDGIGAFDLYSCFPSSIEVARDAFSIPAGDGRPLTVTGGLPYHGGPGSNYVTHSIANALGHLRNGGDDHVLVHGNGYYLTKHSVGIYSRRQPAEAPVFDAGLQGRLDAGATPVAVDLGPPAGTAGSVLAYTVSYGRDGSPAGGIVLAETGEGRTVATTDETLTERLVASDGVGTAVTIGPTGPDEKSNRATLV